MKTVEIQLSRLTEGQTAAVRQLEQEDSMRRRLLDLGMIPGTVVKCLRVAPAGSPVIYEIRGAMVALRIRDAEKVRVAV